MSENTCSKDLKIICENGKIDIDIENVHERIKELQNIVDAQLS